MRNSPLQCYHLQPRRALESCPWHLLACSCSYLLVSLWLCHSIHRPSCFLLRCSSGQFSGLQEKFVIAKEYAASEGRTGGTGSKGGAGPGKSSNRSGCSSSCSSSSCPSIRAGEDNWVWAWFRVKNCHLFSQRIAPGGGQQMPKFWCYGENY